MPERLGFDRDLTGADFLAFHWRLSGGDPGRTASEVGAAADRVGLERLALGKRLKTYSRGMLQRIGIAQATLGTRTCSFWTSRPREPIPSAWHRAGPDPRRPGPRRHDRAQLPPASGGRAGLRPHRFHRPRPPDALRDADGRGRVATPRHDPRAGRPGRGRVAALAAAAIAAEAGERRTAPPRRRRGGGGREGRAGPSRWPTFRFSRCARRPSSKSSSAEGAPRDEMIRRYLRQKLASPGMLVALGVIALVTAFRLAVDRRARRAARRASCRSCSSRPRRSRRTPPGGALQMILARPLTPHGLSLRPLPRDPRGLRVVSGRLRAHRLRARHGLPAVARPGAHAACRRPRCCAASAAGMLGAVLPAAVLLFFSTFLPGYADVLAYFLLMIALPDSRAARPGPAQALARAGLRAGEGERAPGGPLGPGASGAERRSAPRPGAGPWR